MIPGHFCLTPGVLLEVGWVQDRIPPQMKLRGRSGSTVRKPP